MDGQMITLIGEVALVTTSFNKRHETFASVTLEDITGRVEVTIWNREYERTKELWQEGNIVEVKGRVKVWEDRVRFACNDARIYQTEAASNDEASEKPIPIPPRLERRIVVNLKQTADAVADLATLDRLVSLFRECPGQDEVNLRIVNGTTIHNLKMQNCVNYSLALHTRLTEVVGEGSIKVEQDETIV
jgi:DNA polymerase-3 subunit alpha